MVNYAVFRISENTFCAFYLNRCCLLGEGGRAVWLELEVEKRSFCTLFATHSPSSPAPLCFFPRDTLHLDRGDIIAGWRRSTIQGWRVGFRGQLSPHDRPTAQPLSQNKDVYLQGLEAPIRTSPAYCGRRMN